MDLLDIPRHEARYWRTLSAYTILHVQAGFYSHCNIHVLCKCMKGTLEREGFKREGERRGRRVGLKEEGGENKVSVLGSPYMQLL